MGEAATLRATLRLRDEQVEQLPRSPCLLPSLPSHRVFTPPVHAARSHLQIVALEHRCRDAEAQKAELSRGLQVVAAASARNGAAEIARRRRPLTRRNADDEGDEPEEGVREAWQ